MAELRETAYDHVDGRETFTVTAAERWSIALVNRLKRERPEDVEIVHRNEDGSILARMPFEWMRIVPKKRYDLTDERKKELTDQILRVAKEKGRT